MRVSPIRIPTVSNDGDWDSCFQVSQQTKVPAHQEMDDLCPTEVSGESEEDSTAKEEEETVVGPMFLPKDKLAQSQKKITVLIKEKMHTQANKELIRCVILSRIIFGEEHWKCAQALTNLAYGYLTLRGLPVQAKKHAESARSTLVTWKVNTTSNKEKNEIVETLVMLYYTLGVAWLLQNHGREAYFNLQKADSSMKELTELTKGSIAGLQVSEKDVTVALGRASVAIRRLNLGLAYFEKAIGNVIAAKGEKTIDLISLYEETAQIEQLRRNHKQAIQYLQQAYSICVSTFTEVSPRTAEASALLAKAYAMSRDVQHRDAVELYFVKSITAYQATLGSEDSETITTIEEFSKWLVQNGEKQEAYKLLKATLKSQVLSHGGCSPEVAQTFYNLGSVCFAKGELKKAIQLLKKCLMIQVFLYGSEHSKSRETKQFLTLLQR
ncbi:PREDICTED: tetratricopeptide repeat protein 23-like [Chrysochloris asiatica]|uniref:Tetratricopeptide repeat protein 23-like n=1 Tax=Chrysochloris asiatica TaxID=185453 RepID=A0A9B0U8G1_CHRAS|nr:PREDICTED: tetratricopeptide repeat protein 23-like [Chrysochloris asiatica]